MNEQDNAFIESGQLAFRGIPAMLTKGDWLTLNAMGLDLGAPIDDNGSYTGVLRDAVLATWLATRSPEEKRRSFSAPGAAADKAWEWFEGECDGNMEGMGETWGALVKHKIEAQIKPKSPEGKTSEGELPP